METNLDIVFIPSSKGRALIGTALFALEIWPNEGLEIQALAGSIQQGRRNLAIKNIFYKEV